MVDEAAATQIVRNLVGDARPRRRDHRHLAVGQQRDVRHPPAVAAACSAPATPSTGTRRATGWARTPRSRTPTTWPGSSPRCSTGQAAPSLLETYSTERAPVAKQIVLRANKSSREFVPVLRGARAARRDGPRREMAASDRGAQGEHPGGRGQARGAGRGDGAEELRVQRARRRARPVLRLGRGGRRRHARARSRPATPSCTTSRRRCPGSRLPHAWVGDSRAQALDPSTSRPMTRFTLITGIAGEALGRGRGRRSPRTRRAARGGRHRPGPRGHRPLLRLGASCARSTRTARCWSAPTSTSAGARSSLPDDPEAALLRGACRRSSGYGGGGSA